MTLRRSDTKLVTDTLESGANGAAVRIGQTGGGCTGYDKKTKRPVVVEVPVQRDAYARTVALHELIHAQTSGPRHGKHRKFSEECRQLVEDLRVHTLKWPRSPHNSRIDRDAMVVALTDIRGATADLPGIYVAIRSLAISDQVRTSVDVEYKTTTVVQKRFRELFGPRVAMSVVMAVKAIRRDNYPGDKRAHELIEALLDSQRKIDKLMEGTPTPKPTGELKDTNASDRKMTIVELAMSVTCEGAPQRVRKNSGSKLRIGAYVKAVATGTMQPLFESLAVREPQGTVLIDASGSMAPSPSELAMLAGLLPAATIATYCGDNDSGELTIVAKDGKRAAVVPPQRWYGNDVDDLATEWLLSQPAPRRFLTDLGFTCPNSGRWRQVVRDLDRVGRIELIESNSIHDLIGMFNPL